MKGKIIKDWSTVDFYNPKHKEKAIAALQHFMVQPFKEGTELHRALHHFTTKGDFPAEVLQVLEKYHATQDFDLGYEQIFDIRDFTGTNESGFKILDVESGIVFDEVPIGGKAKVYGMSGSMIDVPFVRYGGGLNWDRTLIDDKQYWTLEDNAIAFRNRAAYDKAAAYYSLIEAVPATHNVTWQVPTPANLADTDRAYMAVRDANTMNKAAENTLLALKDNGYAINPNTEMICLAPVQLKGRIERALGVKAEGYQGAPNQMNFNIRPVYSMMLSSSTEYYIILPKRKIKGGNRQNLTILADFDILAYADTTAGWMRFSGAIGDIKQIRRCAIA